VRWVWNVVGMAITAGSLHLSADRTLVPFLALLFVFFFFFSFCCRVPGARLVLNGGPSCHRLL
jgi:hypothetical protein